MESTRTRNTFSPLVSDLSWGGRATRAEVDLDAIAENVRALKASTSAREFLAVVKSDGYGHGSLPVARAAVAAGADRLGVFTVDEGVALRLGGITAPILVFGPFLPAEAPLFWQYNLTPNITNLTAAEALHAVSSGNEIGYHLKIDTGLTRAGAEPERVVDLVEAISALPSLRPEGLFTHFARADEADKTSALQQFKVFCETADRLAAAGHPFPVRHVSNSGAIHDLPALALDMVRCGISIYGYYPSSEVSTDIPLRPALQLVSAVSRAHTAKAGTGIGYGHEFRCETERRIALVPIGYGDGLPRTFGYGNGSVLIRGKSAPVVARISMDQITVDVSEIDDVQIGDLVTLVGAQGDATQTADDIARQTGTINYDILTGIMPRVPRIYTRAGKIVGSRRYLPSDTGAEGVATLGG